MVDIMKKVAPFLVTLVFFFALIAAVTAIAQTEGTSGVIINVSSINEISLSGNPGALTVSSATPGSEPDSVVDSSTTWNISTNNSGMKMTGNIDLAMPSGVTLEVQLQAPGGASSQGYQSLTTTSKDLVLGINGGYGSSLTINYRLSATVNAAIGSGGRTITISLVSQ